MSLGNLAYVACLQLELSQWPLFWSNFLLMLGWNNGFFVLPGFPSRVKSQWDEDGDEIVGPSSR